MPQPGRWCSRWHRPCAEPWDRRTGRSVRTAGNHRSGRVPWRAQPLAASGHDAAVDVPDRAGHPAGFRGQQEGDRGCQVARRAHPAQRVEPLEAVQGLFDLVLGNETLTQGRADDGRGDRVDADLVGASSMARLWVRACSPALATKYADDGVAATAWWAHMLPMLTMAPPRPASTMPRTTVWVRKKIARSSSR